LGGGGRGTKKRRRGQAAVWGKRGAEAGGTGPRADQTPVGAVGKDKGEREAFRRDTEGKAAALAGKAQQAWTIILDDGTSVVFPEIVQQLRDDLRQSGKWLGEARTDSLETGLQDEIETTLKELIEALEKARQPKPPPPPGGQGGWARPGTGRTAEGRRVAYRFMHIRSPPPKHQCIAPRPDTGGTAEKGSCADHAY